MTGFGCAGARFLRMPASCRTPQGTQLIGCLRDARILPNLAPRHRACRAAGGAAPGGRARPEAGVNTVLVLNQNYEPINVCNARRAVVLLDWGKAEMLEHRVGAIRTPT